MRYTTATALRPAALLLVLAAVSAAAQEDGGFGTPLPTPAAPTSPIGGEGVEPDVTIIETETEVIYEYRVNGQVYMVKIDPLVGPPYFLLDSDGDGTLDVQDNRPPELAVPQWLLFSW
jgi:hypothetical protein